MADAVNTAGSAKSRYDRLIADRSHFVTEAEKSAALTIPALFPTTTDIRQFSRSSHRRVIKPYQSLGARGVNNLSSKLLLTLLPPTSPFFRYRVSPKALIGLDKNEAAEVLGALSEALAKREKMVVNEVDTQNLRVKAFEAFRHLLVTGNITLYLPPTGGMQLFPLNSYVVSRDGEGNLIELVYVEVLDRQTLPEKIAEVLPSELPDPSQKDQPVEVYTSVCREGDRFTVRQELASGTLVPDSEGSYSLESLPWLVLRYTAVDGEDYGRGFVEEYRGDLAALETISKALQFAAVNAAKLVLLVNPNGFVKLRSLRKAENGEAIEGQDGDVTFLRLDKGQDLAFATNMRQDLQRGLAADFLLNSSFQRPGERVTAEEIRRMAEELEDSLGGIYSVLSQEFQLPLARRIEAQLVSQGAIKRLPNDSVQPAVVTGLAAIGRGHDLERLRALLAMVAEAGQVVQGLADFFDTAEIARRIAVGSGVDTDGLLRSEQEVNDLNAQRQRTAMMQQVVADGVKGAAGPVAGALAGRFAEAQPKPGEQT